MRLPIKAIVSLAGILIACMIISTEVLTYRSSGKAIRASNSMVEKELTEYTSSDLTMLEVNVLSGTQVLDVIRKYQTTIPVKVITERGSTVYPQSSLAVVNDPTSIGWISPNDVFDLTITRTRTGAPCEVVAVARGVKESTDESVTDINVAKAMMATALGTQLTDNTTWEKLAKLAEGSNSVAVKQSLANVLGSYSTDETDWATLTKNVRAKVTELEAQVAELKNQKETNSVQKLEGSILPGGTETLDYVPTMIAVITETGAEVFQSGIWHGGNSCTLDGTILSNQSSYTVTYYAYK